MLRLTTETDTFPSFGLKLERFPGESWGTDPGWRPGQRTQNVIIVNNVPETWPDYIVGHSLVTGGLTSPKLDGGPGDKRFLKDAMDIIRKIAPKDLPFISPQFVGKPNEEQISWQFVGESS